MMASGDGGEAPRREVLHRGNDPKDLARAFASNLGKLDGLRRALAAWALARDTLEGTMAARRVEEGACHKGCAWCCNFQVTVRFADAAHLARRARAEPVLEARVRATAARIGHLGDPVARLKAAIPCAFLDRGSGACSVYEDRPLACRAYRSRDAGWCRSLVGTDQAHASGQPVVKEGLALRALVTEAMVAVTPAEWRAKGELHAMVMRVLDTLPKGGGG
jgi:Fe-S-cluster containining protein